MKFVSLGSGSAGNSTLIEARQGLNKTCVMLDCGFSIKQIQNRLARSEYQPDDISAVVVTHEHADHVGSALTFCKKFNIKLVMTWGTALVTKALDYSVKEKINLEIIEPGFSFALDSMMLYPFTVPHDAREPVQYIFSDGVSRLGVLTDLGCVTPYIELVLQGCDGLILECNHDKSMLASGNYPPTLKARIGGDYGHLSNCQAAKLLSKIYHPNLKHVVAAHLSEENNCSNHVRLALSKVLNTDSRDILLADQLNGTKWLSC